MTDITVTENPLLVWQGIMTSQFRHRSFGAKVATLCWYIKKGMNVRKTVTAQMGPKQRQFFFLKGWQLSTCDNCHKAHTAFPLTESATVPKLTNKAHLSN